MTKYKCYNLFDITKLLTCLLKNCFFIDCIPSLGTFTDLVFCRNLKQTDRVQNSIAELMGDVTGEISSSSDEDKTQSFHHQPRTKTGITSAKDNKPF